MFLLAENGEEVRRRPIETIRAVVGELVDRSGDVNAFLSRTDATFSYCRVKFDSLHVVGKFFLSTRPASSKISSRWLLTVDKMYVIRTPVNIRRVDIFRKEDRKCNPCFKRKSSGYRKLFATILYARS